MRNEIRIAARAIGFALVGFIPVLQYSGDPLEHERYVSIGKLGAARFSHLHPDRSGFAKWLGSAGSDNQDVIGITLHEAGIQSLADVDAWISGS